MFQFDKFFWSSKKFDFRQVFEKFGKLSKVNKRFWMIRFDKFFLWPSQECNFRKVFENVREIIPEHTVRFCTLALQPKCTNFFLI